MSSFKFYVEVKESKGGRLFPVLMCSLEGTPHFVSFDKMLICELLDMSPKSLSELVKGSVIELI